MGKVSVTLPWWRELKCKKLISYFIVVIVAIILCIVGSVFCVLVVVDYWYGCSSVCLNKKIKEKKVCVFEQTKVGMNVWPHEAYEIANRIG